MRFKAIRIVHPTVTSLRGDTEAFDAQGNLVILDEPLIQVEYDKLMLASNIEAKVQEINTLCGNQITSGFTSTALGSTYYYQSKQLDQLNLIGLVTAGTDDYLKCSLDGVTFDYVLHTVAQLQQVLVDGKTYKASLLSKASTLKQQAKTATSQADLDLVVW